MQKNTMDLTDLKIMSFLDLDARMPNSSIAKKLRVSREVVDYRIKRLVKEDIIKRFYSHIHAQKTGYSVYKVYLKTKGMDSSKEGELKNYLIKNANVFRFISCDGVYDVIVSIAARDIYEMNRIMKDFLSKYDEFLLSKEVTISTGIYHFRKEHLLGKKNKDIEPLFNGGEKGTIILDKKDNEIVKILANNARMHVSSLGKRIGITSSAVISRIKALKNKGVIGAFRCSIDMKKLGFTSYRMLLSLKFIDQKKEKELHQFCMQTPNIVLFLYCIGRWDMEIEIEVENSQEFHVILKEIKSRFSNIISQCDYVMNSTEYKFDLFPGCYPPGLI